MWAALALSTVLMVPAQGGDLAVKNVRSTYGIFGQTRKDNKLLPGDLLVVAFEVENLTVQPNGKVLFAMGTELTKKGKAKPEYKHDPEDKEAYNTLGGTSMPHFAFALLGMDTLPGEYTLKVTFKDLGGKKPVTVTLEEKFEVLPIKLGFVQVRLTSERGDPSPLVCMAGQTVLLNCALVGFEVDKVAKKPSLTFEMQVIDDAGKPTLTKSYKGDITEEPKAVPGMMIFQPIPLVLNREGKFKVKITGTCNVSKKSTDHVIDLTVLKAIPEK